MPNGSRIEVETTVREALVALESVIRGRVHFLPVPDPHLKAEEVIQSLDLPDHHCVMPIVHGQRCFGVLTLETDPYDEQVYQDGASQHEVLALFARMLANSLSQARSLKHRVEELNAVYRVSAAMTQSPSLDDLLHTALETVMDVVDVTAGSIRLLRRAEDGEGNPDELLVRAAINLSQEYFDRGPVIAAESELDTQALAGEMVYVEDLASDPRVRYPDLVRSENLQSFLCTGLLFDGIPLGIIRLYTKRSHRSFSEYEQGLVRVTAQQIAAAIANRTLMLERREARQAQRQLQLASSVQQRMLPQVVPDIPGIDLAARCIPSLELGGDFFDFITLDSQNVGLAIGDVVGKGVPAALMAASVKAELRAHARYLYDLDEVMTRTNRDLVHDTKPNEFATLWYGVIDVTTKRLTYCNAGHEPALVCRENPQAPGTYEFLRLFNGGMIIGFDETTTYSRAFLELQPGDILIAFSDGLTDAMNFEDHRYGLPRVKQALLDLIESNQQVNADDILNHLLWEVRRFFGFRKQTDDITLLVALISE